MQSWEIQLLGAPLTLRKGRECITHFPTEKVGLLLAYLAAFPQQLPTREELVELFWPDSEPDAGRVSLRQALASLRRLLEPPDIPAGTVLAADRTRVWIQPEAMKSDLALWDRLRTLANQDQSLSERLHRLEEAVHSYGGAFLPGAYADWALEERQRRQEQYLEVLLRLIDSQTECGDYAAAVVNAQRLLHTDLLHEEGHERLMHLYIAQGKPGLARSQYRKLCRLLRDELNFDPDAKLQALSASLKQTDRKRQGNALFPIPISSEILHRPEPAKPSENENSINLPLFLTRFFGRTEELGQLHGWLNDPEVRLITLTGIGGVGKTRLALETAKQKTRFGPAVTFVALSETQDAALFLPAILKALGVPGVSTSDPLPRIASLLGSKPHLLILDNFEQIAEQAAEMVWGLLEAVRNITCLITSRQALNLSGERVLALAPLPIPNAHLPHELITHPTVQLLIDRMRVRRPDFQVTPANAAAVASLCARLEGIPLAIELAAGWARDLTVSQMQDRLAHRFDLLVSHQRGIPPRHQSLRAAIESSYQSLPASLQQFFLRLSVFRGGWQEGMVEIAVGASGSANSTMQVEYLRALREHSLITVRETGNGMRYGMLETLRAFGQETLTSEENLLSEKCHAAWFLDFAREADGKLHGQEQAYWLDRLEEEQENLRAALEYGVAQDPQNGLRLANALYWFWYVRGYNREGEQWLTTLLERVPDTSASERAWGLLAAGHLANCQSNNIVAVSRYEEALALFEEAGNATGAAHALCRLGNAAQEMLDITTACRLCAESVARFRALNDSHGLLLALFYYANTLSGADRQEEGEACLQEALPLAEGLGDIRFQSILLQCLGYSYWAKGEVSYALKNYRNSVQLQLFLREPLPLSYILRDLSRIAIVHGTPALATRLYGAMQGLRQRIGYPTALHEQFGLQALEDQLHAGQEETDYNLAFETGKALDFDTSLHLALETAEIL